MNSSFRSAILTAALLTEALFATSIAASSAAPWEARTEALKACPVIEEEIIDLGLLADGLKRSSSVGMLEKIRLKRSVDSLMKRLAQFHEGAQTYTLPQLQEQYDVLLMRIAAHLQHEDTVLHGQLCNAWDMIWLDLVDPKRFAETYS